MPWLFVLIWSTGFVVARYAMPHATPMDFLALRFVLSLGAFLLWVWWSKAPWPADRWQWLHLGITGALVHAGYLGGVWSAVHGGMSAGTVALICGFQPLLTALWVQSASSGPKVTRQQWCGLGLGLLGLVLVVWHKVVAAEANAGTLALAVAALLGITVGTLYQKRYVKPLDVRSANAVQLAAASLLCLPLALWRQDGFDWHPHLIGALIWSVAVLTLGGSSLLYLLVQKGAATQVTSLLYLVPPCTALLGWLLFDEALGPVVLLGMAITAWGVWWVVRPHKLLETAK